MTTEMNFEQFLFREVEPGQRWQLICPVCFEGLDIVSGLELSAISFMQVSSICIDCDPAAAEPIPYQVVGSSQLASTGG